MIIFALQYIIDSIKLPESSSLKKTIKISLIIFFSLIVILLILKFSFGLLIKTQIKNFTNHGVTLDYKSSNARFWKGSINFREAVIQFNDISIDSSSSVFIKSISFEEFSLSHLSLKALLFERSFKIEKVLLKGPSIDFLKDTTIRPNDIFSKILTPNVVSEKSKSAPFGFEIEEVEIVHGSFQLIKSERKDFSLGSVNLKLSNIGMEDLKILNSDAPDLNAQFNIRLGIYKIQKKLSGNAELLIDSIIYKKDKRVFQTGGIQLNNLNSATNYAASEISLTTDLVAVEGFSLSHLLSSKDLKFSRLTISNTEIFEKLDYYDEIIINADKPASKKQFISNFVNAFITDTFNIQNFNYKSQNNLSETFDHIDNLNLWVYSLHVDSNFILEKEFLRPVELSNVLSGPIQMHMPEKGIDVSCDTLIYEGPGREQIVTGFSYHKYPSLYADKKEQATFKINSDSIIISGLDEREWIDSSIVEFSIFIQNPKFKGSQIPFANSASTKSKSSDVLPEKIIFNRLSLVNGNIEIDGDLNEQIDIGSLNIDVFELELFLNPSMENKIVSWQNLITALENSKVFIPGKLDLELQNGTIYNNDLDFSGVLFSKVHEVNNFASASKKLPDTTRFIANEVEIDNLDLQAFINRKHLSIDRFKISKPEYFQYNAIKQKKEHPDTITPLLLYRRINKLLPDYFSHIDVKDFGVHDASFIYHLEQNNLRLSLSHSLRMRNIVFDQNVIEGKKPKLIVDKYEFCLDDIQLESDQLLFNSESMCYNSIENNLLIKNSHANNAFLRDSELLSYNVTIPEIQLTKPDFTPLSGGPFSFDMLYMMNPDIYLNISSNQKHDKSIQKQTNLLPFAFLEDGISIENAKAIVCLKSETDSTIIKVSELAFKASELYKIIGADQYHTKNRNVFQHLDFQLNDISLNGSGIKLDIENLDYDKQSGIISINPIKQELYSKPGTPEFSGSISIPSIRIEYPDMIIVDNRIKSYGAINLLIPDVNVDIESAKKEQPAENRNIRLSVNDSSLRNFLGKVDFFHIDSTVLDNIGFFYRTIADSGGGSFEIERVSLLVDKLKIDSSHFDFHEKRIAKDIVLQLHDREVVTADSMYHFTVNNVTYYYSRDKIVIDSFEVIPGFERHEFFKRAGFQTDLMQVKFDRLVAEGIDLISILESKKLQVNKLTLDKFHLIDYRDQHYPRKENDFKKLPEEALFNLPFVLDIDTMQVNKAFLLYGEYVDKSPEPGEIYFTNFDASIYNVSNITPAGNEHDSLFAQITTDIMNKSKMKVDLTIPLHRSDDKFWIRGNVEKLDLRNFNSMTENLFGISIIRGKGGLNIPLITFSDTTSKGSVIFKYDKLKLAMYNRNKAKLNRGLGSGLIDFMLNGVLIKSNNPTFLGKTRIVDVYAERNLERSFFNYVWKSTMSGLMATMGFYNKDQREEKKERKVEEKTERKDEKQMNKLNK